MFLVQCILYNKFKYWLAKDDKLWYWSGIKNSAFEFTSKGYAEQTARIHSKVDFTIEKII